MRLALLAGLLPLLCAAAVPPAGQVTLTWINSVYNTDGTAAGTITETKIFVADDALGDGHADVPYDINTDTATPYAVVMMPATTWTGVIPAGPNESAHIRVASCMTPTACSDATNELDVMPNPVPPGPVAVTVH